MVIIVIYNDVSMRIEQDGSLLCEQFNRPTDWTHIYIHVCIHMHVWMSVWYLSLSLLCSWWPLLLFVILLHTATWFFRRCCCCCCCMSIWRSPNIESKHFNNTNINDDYYLLFIIAMPLPRFRNIRNILCPFYSIKSNSWSLIF